MMNSPRSRQINAPLAGACYFACASATIVTTRYDGGVAYLWVATAFLTARLSTASFSAWPPLLLFSGVASFLATAIFGVGLGPAIILAPVNVAEGALAAWLVRRRLGHTRYFESVSGLVTFVLLAGVSIPFVLSIPAALAVATATGTSFWLNQVGWFAGHALGTIAFTPMAMLILNGETKYFVVRGSTIRRTEALFLFGLVIAVSYLVFSQSALPLLFLPMLPMMIVTMRFGRLGASGSTVILMMIGGVMTMRGIGPIDLIRAPMGQRVQFFQFYVTVAAMLVLPIAALLKQRKDLMNRLAQSEAGYRLLAQHSGDAIINLTIDGTILYASPSVRQLGGFVPEALVGRNGRELVIAEDSAAVVAAHRNALRQPDTAFAAQYRGVTGHGDPAWFEMTIRAVLNELGVVVGAVSTIRDITARKAVEQSLTQAACTDPLTGLYNRREFERQLQLRVSQVWNGEGQCAVAIFDLDHFKSVNDTHGHAAGDAVLQSFAATAKRTLRDTDVVGRLGGEEFGVVLWKADANDAAKVCDRLRNMLAGTPVTLNSVTSLIVTTSVGVAAVLKGQDAADALRRADEALYEAKNEGRNRLRLSA